MHLVRAVATTSIFIVIIPLSKAFIWTVKKHINPSLFAWNPMMDTSSNRSSSKSKVEVIPFEVNHGDAEHHLNQIQSLFVDGMKINDAPEGYIQASLRSDLNDPSSMRETYLSGRGTFLMLVEDDEDDAIPQSNGNGSNDNQRKTVKGIVGLQDISPTTGNAAAPQNDDGGGPSEKHNLCELRRMSIHSSSRRLGYGAQLVQECISHAKRNKFDGIKLYTGGWMEAAIKFYLKMGFEDRGRLDYKNDDGSTVEIAHLELIF